MGDEILLTQLNDFIFCPASIYFHLLYGSMEKVLYQCSDQLNGSNAHKSVDEQHYTTSQYVLQGIDVYCEKYGLLGKIDLYDTRSGILTERKKKINTIYDGYVFQLYGQYFAMQEMGYQVKQIRLHSIDDNKNYIISKPEEDEKTLDRFVNLINTIRTFQLDDFEQENREKCARCIYEPACDRGKK